MCPSGSPPLPPSPPPLPLFSRCPFTNQVLKLGISFPLIQIIFRLSCGVFKSHPVLQGTESRSILFLSHQGISMAQAFRWGNFIFKLTVGIHCKKWSIMYYATWITTRRPWPSVNPPSPPAASSKPSLDAILCTSLVALTNKHRCTPDI